MMMLELLSRKRLIICWCLFAYFIDKSLALKPNTRVSKTSTFSFRELQKATVTTAILLTCIATPASAVSNEASKLYFEAEQAISSTEKTFSVLGKEYSSTKRLLVENTQITGKAINIMNSLDLSTADLQEKLSKSVTAGKDLKVKFDELLDSLSVSTSEKFNVAEASAAALERPGKTAQKFLLAQNEQAVLERESASRKLLESETEKVAAQLEKSTQLFNSVKGILEKVTKSEESDKSAAVFLDNGIETITKNCRDNLSECSSKEQNGASLFKKGIDLVKQSESSFFKALKELEDNTKAIKSIDSGLLAIVDTLEKEDLAVKDWEESTKLRLKLGKPALQKTKQDLISIEKETSKVLIQLDHALGDLKKDIKLEKNGKSSQYKKLFESLKNTDYVLEAAEKGAQTSEKLLRQAKDAGGREASTYLKKDVVYLKKVNKDPAAGPNVASKKI